MRLILLQSGNENNNLEFRYLRWEGMWQFLEDEEVGWDSALRFEVQLADTDDLPSRVRLAWSSKWDLDSNWQFRTNVLTKHQFGEDAGDGYFLEGRAQLTRKWTANTRIGVDWYGDFNTIEDIGSFDEQEHQLGPLLKFDLDENWGGQAGVLLGVSDAAADSEFRLHLIYGF